MNQFSGLYSTNLRVLLALAVAVLLCYIKVMTGDFVFDDDTFILHNLHIHSLDKIPVLYKSCLTDGSFIGNCNFYRPNQALFHNLIYHFFGANSMAFHTFSILVHWVNGLLVFFLLKKLSFSRKASFISAVIFCIHPMQTEAVSYISGLSDPLGLCFMLCSILSLLYAFEQAEAGKKWLFIFISLLAYCMAMLSKESAVVLVALASLIFFCKSNLFSGKNRVEIFSFVGVLCLLAGTYLYLKFTVFNFTGNFGLTGEKNVYTENILVRLTTFITIFPKYLEIIFFPKNLFIEKPYTAYEDIRSFMGIVGLLSLASIFYFMYRSFINARLFLLGMGWFFICLAPVSGIVPINAIYLEHWLYIPSVGLMILLAALIDKFEKKQLKIVLDLVLGVYVVFFSFRTFARNMEWSDAVKFYQNEIKHMPTARIHNNLAMVQADRRMYNDAIKNYLKAIEMYDAYPQTHHNLANLYLTVGRRDEAIQQFYIAIYMDPQFVYSHQKLYEIYLQENRTDKAAIFENFLRRVTNGQQVTKEEVEQVYRMK